MAKVDGRLRPLVVSSTAPDELNVRDSLLARPFGQLSQMFNATQREITGEMQTDSRLARAQSHVLDSTLAPPQPAM